MTNEQVINSVKELTDKYQTLCDELLEQLRLALLDNQNLRLQLKELQNG